MTRPDGGTRTYVYNDDGQLTALIDPDGAAQTFGYDMHARLTDVTPKGYGYPTEYVYDDADRLVTRVGSDLFREFRATGFVKRGPAAPFHP